MARRRRRKRRRRRIRRWARRRKPKIPLEVLGAGIAIPFVPPRDGWSSPFDAVQSQDWRGLGGTLAMGFAGVDTLGGEPMDVFAMLNPFDMSRARYTKMLIWAGVASKIRKKFVRIPFDRVPLVGKYIS